MQHQKTSQPLTPGPSPHGGEAGKTPHERPHILYLLLLVVGLVFTLTAVAYGVIPVLEQKALEAGNPPPPSEWREALRADGWRWLLYEAAVLVVVALASMAWDHLRSLQKPGASPTIPGEKPPQT